MSFPGGAGIRGRVPIRVLVIDDEEPIRLLCRVNLEAEGMIVLEASDGLSGLALARAATPDVILLDVMMPGLDGWGVAEELLDDPTTEDIPFVFLTARAEVRDRARGLDLGGVDYVTKPFNPIDLAPLVRGLLDRVSRGEQDDLRREKLAELRLGLERTYPLAGEVGGHDVGAAVALERPGDVADPDAAERRPQEVRSMLRAREPGRDDRVRLSQRPGAPGEVLARGVERDVELQHPAAEGAVAEGIRFEHLAAVRARGPLEVCVVLQRGQVVGVPNAVHLPQQRGLLRVESGAGREGDDERNERTEKEESSPHRTQGGRPYWVPASPVRGV